MSAPAGRTIPAVRHHRSRVGGRDVHRVEAGDAGSTVLLVHGFPESWWAFHRLIPLLAKRHRVVAIDLPGFGDSGREAGDYSSSAIGDVLVALLEDATGPAHVVAQDVGGPSAVRAAHARPDLVTSLTAIETALPGFGWELLPTFRGTWHIDAIATPGVPELLLAGRERRLLAEHLVPSMTGDPARIDDDDLDELARGYAQPGGFVGAGGLYRSLFDDDLRPLVADRRLSMPVLAIGAGTGSFTADAMRAVADDVTAAQLPAGIGHMAALEDAGAVAAELLPFLSRVDAG